MKSDKKSADTPYQCINVMTNEVIGWYDSENSAYLDNPDTAIDVSYRRPRRTK